MLVRTIRIVNILCICFASLVRFAADDYLMAEAVVGLQCRVLRSFFRYTLVHAHSSYGGALPTTEKICLFLPQRFYFAAKWWQDSGTRVVGLAGSLDFAG